MLQTALLEQFLVQKTEEQNREENVKDCIDKIRPLNKELVDCIEYKNKNFIQKIKTLFLSFGFWAMTSFPIFLFIGSLIKISTKSKIDSLDWFIVFLCFILLMTIFYIIFKRNWYDEEDLLNNEEENKKYIIRLFSSLSDKKFEIRGELLENYSKLKLIIEENQYIDGTTSVIKNSSKSLTAYINMTESKELIIKSVVSVVKESERKFS